MKITIRTKYIPATDTNGAKIIAIGMGKQKSIPYPYELSGEAVHIKAAKAWVDWHMTRQGWCETSKYINTIYTPRGYVHTIK